MKRFAAWFGGHPLRPAITSIVAILVLGAAAPLASQPQLERDWYPYLGRTAHVQLDPNTFEITPVSDWSYASGAETAETYGEARFAFADLRRVWFMLEPQPGSKLAAHTLLLFEFEGDRLLGVTIEARRERNEDYSAVTGLFNAYELAYVWGSARDFLTRRTVMLGHDVFVYPIEINEQQKHLLLRRLLQRTRALETEARYYNTISSNCTNELAKAIDLDWSIEWVLTGLSDEYLFDRQVIPGETFDAAHARADVTGYVNALNAIPAERFDAELLAELRRRNGL